MLEGSRFRLRVLRRIYSRSEGLLFPSLSVDAEHQEPEDNRIVAIRRLRPLRSPSDSMVEVA
jgi:hypothetical protein